MRTAISMDMMMTSSRKAIRLTRASTVTVKLVPMMKDVVMTRTAIRDPCVSTLLLHDDFLNRIGRREKRDDRRMASRKSPADGSSTNLDRTAVEKRERTERQDDPASRKHAIRTQLLPLTASSLDA